MHASQAGSFGSFRVPDFRILFVGTLLSFTAFFMSTIVQSIVAFELTGLNGAVGVAVFGQGLGMVLFGPLGGAYADRLPKRRVVAVGQCVSGLSLATLGFLYSTGRLEVIHLAINSFVMGGAFGFFGPARQALVVELVPDALRGNAMTLSNVANNVSRLFGPALAGFLVATEGFGAEVAYASMAVLYLGSALLLLPLPRSVVRDGVERTHVLEDLVQGLGYSWRHVRLRNLLFFFVSVMLIGFPHVVLLAGWLDEGFGRPESDVAVVAFVSALGGFGASLYLARFADRTSATAIYAGLAIAFGVALVALAFAPSFEIGLLAMVLVGATNGGFHALNGAVIASVTEQVFMGRVLSLTFLAFAGFSLTAWPIGLAADAFGVRVVLTAMGLAVFTTSILLSRLVLRDARSAAQPAGEACGPA